MFRFEGCQEIPHKGGRWGGGGVVELEDKVYWGLGGGGVYCLDKKNRWKKWTDDVEWGTTLAVCGGMLVQVGSYVSSGDGAGSNKVMEWRGGRWSHMSDMMVGCGVSGVVSVGGGGLVVMGGQGDGGSLLNAVQVFDGKTWHFGPSLPKPCRGMSAVVYGNQVILMGGWSMDKKVWCANINDLIAVQSLEDTQQSIWRELPDIPYYSSAVCVVDGVLLAIGGAENALRTNVTSAIYALHPVDQKWQNVGNMVFGGCYVDTLLLSGGRLLVFDGLNQRVLRVHVTVEGLPMFFPSPVNTMPIDRRLFRMSLGEGVIPKQEDSNGSIEQVFVRYYAELKRTVNPDDIAAELFAKGVITENEKAEVDHVMYTVAVRMDKLLGAVQRAIPAHNNYFHIFLEVLDAIPKYKDLVRRMKANFQVTAPTNWKTGKLLGSGACGKVFMCLDQDTGRELAVKMVDIYGTESSQMQEEVQMLETELQLLKNLRHERIVTYYGAERKDGNLCIFMEFMQGGSVSQYLKDTGALTETLTSKYTKQILEGVVYLHDNKIVHRDIKGDNILIDSNDNIKLADFGTAKRLQTIKSGLKSVKGTPNWMAPEVIRAESYTEKADIWSLGVTVVEMLTGHPPWHGLESYQIMYKIGTENAHPNLPSDCSEHAKHFFQLCFKKDPSQRPSAQELLDNPFVINS